MRNQTLSFAIDLNDGSVDTNPEPVASPFQDGAYTSEDLDIDLEYLGNNMFPTVLIEKDNGVARNLGIYQEYAIEEPFFVGAITKNYPKSEYNNGRRFQTLAIHDLTGDGSPTIMDMPFKFKGFKDALARLERSIGIDIHTGDYPIFCFGGGYLTIWSWDIQRVGLWKVDNPMKPEFVGVAPIPNFFGQPIPLVGYQPDSNTRHIAPLLRPDGALGYMVPNYGPMWLEFPALMKEEKRS